MDKPALIAGLLTCPWFWVIYQLVVMGNPAFLFHLLVFAAMVKVFVSDGVAKEGTGDSRESHLQIGTIISDDQDGFKGGDSSEEIPEVVQHLVSGMLEAVDAEAAYSDSPKDSGELSPPIETAPDDFDELDLEEAHPSQEFLKEQPEVQVQLNSAPDEDCNTSNESNCPAEVTKPDEGDFNTSDGPESPDEVALETSDSPDYNFVTDAPEEHNCLAEDACPSGDISLRRLKVDLAVGGVRLRKEPPKLQVDFDVRKPRFIETSLVSAAVGDAPLPSPEFFYNYRYFYFRHRGNWREMRSKGVHRPSLASIEEEECRPEIVVVGGTVVERIKAKGAKKRLRRRIRKLFREWKESRSCLLPMF